MTPVRIGLSSCLGVYGIHEALQHVRVGIGQYAVTEIEHVAGSTTRRGEHFGHARTGHIPACQRTHRIQVALNAAMEADALPGVVEAYPPVDADQITAR